MTRVLLATLAFYRRWLSPALHSLSPGGCRYQPTCSDYAAVAIATHGPVRGLWLAFGRLLRCHPFARGGLDNVPARVPSKVSHGAVSSHIPHEPLP
jgi:putative membrane protein insertion efficiency factor